MDDVTRPPSSDRRAAVPGDPPGPGGHHHRHRPGAGHDPGGASARGPSLRRGRRAVDRRDMGRPRIPATTDPRVPSRTVGSACAGRRQTRRSTRNDRTPVLDELARVEGGPPDVVGGTAPVGRIGEHVVDGQPSTGHDVGCPAPEVGPGRLLAVAAVDEAEGQRRGPPGAHRGRVADQAHHRRLELGGDHGPAPVGERVDATGGGVDQRGVVVLPPGLVLLGTVVVVEAEQDRTGLLGRRPEVGGGLAAPGADLDDGGRRRGRTGPQGGQEEGLALVVGHEPRGGAGQCEQVLPPGLDGSVVPGRGGRAGRLHPSTLPRPGRSVTLDGVSPGRVRTPACRPAPRRRSRHPPRRGRRRHRGPPRSC